MKYEELKLTEAGREALCKRLHFGIAQASHPSGVYESIAMIESALVELWEGGVTDAEIWQSVKSRNFNKCYDAIASARRLNEQRATWGIESKDAARLEMLLAQLTYPSYASYLSFKEAEKAAEEAKIKVIHAKWAIEEAYQQAQEYLGTPPVLLEHPVINVRNVKAIFGVNSCRIHYENENGETKAVFQIYCDKLEDFDELVDRFSGKEITYSIKTKWIDSREIQYIELQGVGASQLEYLIQELLLPASEVKTTEEMEHPIFNKKNIKAKLNLIISSVECSGGFLSQKYLKINFPSPFKEPLQEFTKFLNKKRIFSEPGASSGYIKISGINLDEFVALLGGTKIDYDREFHLHHSPLPKRHKEIFDKKNIMKAFLLPTISQIEYDQMFDRIMFVKIRFNKHQWESAIKLSNLLNKIGIMHDKIQDENYAVTISIFENNMPGFIYLLTKDSDLLASEFEEKKSIQKENVEKINFPKLDSLPSDLFSEKRPVGITIQAVQNKFGKKIAEAIEKIDLFNYLSGFITIQFYKSDSDEIDEFCRILKIDAIAYDKSGPEKRTIFIEGKKTCKELESLLQLAEPVPGKKPPEPLISKKIEKTSNLTKENISIAFDLELKNIFLIEEKDNEIKILFKKEENISTITYLESELAREDILSLYSRIKLMPATSQAHCIKIKSDDHLKFVQLVQKKCQEKITSLLQPSPGIKLQIDGID